jgi:hypothetical protein
MEISLASHDMQLEQVEQTAETFKGYDQKLQYSKKIHTFQCPRSYYAEFLPKDGEGKSPHQ